MFSSEPAASLACGRNVTLSNCPAPSPCSISTPEASSLGTGTSAYRAYSRAHEISAQGKTAIAGSSDPVFRGDTARWNLAELLIAALSACHQLWYLHLCADAGIVVVAYSRGQRARSK